MNKFICTIFKYIGGILEVVQEFFSDKDEAIKHGDKHGGGHEFKVYDHNGNLEHCSYTHRHRHNDDTYA